MDAYREEILEHYKNPLNKGRLKNPTKSIHNANPLCGDSVDIDLIIENGIIKDVRFEGKGCAISIASASIFLDKIKGMRLGEVKKISSAEVTEPFGENLTVSRIKCATLAYKALLENL